jgi:hypothetical protein
LDKRTNGYIRPEKFYTPQSMQVVVEKTKLGKERVETLMEGWQKQIQRECAVLQQLERETEDIKQQSHKHSVSSQNLALPIMP